MIVKTLPRFDELPKEKQTLTELKLMYQNPPILYMHLEDLEREEKEIRGAYDCSQPDIDVKIAIKYGRKYTQWLTREPDWRKSRKPNAEIHLVEVTPIAFSENNKQFHMNANWQIIVIGEEEQKRKHFNHRANSSAMMRRAEEI